ncbi:MAG: hypothetical protein ACE5FQ_16155, partial [Thiogranum sp.]
MAVAHPHSTLKGVVEPLLLREKPGKPQSSTQNLDQLCSSASSSPYRPEYGAISSARAICRLAAPFVAFIPLYFLPWNVIYPSIVAMA